MPTSLLPSSPKFRFLLGGVAALLVVGMLATVRSPAVSRNPVVFVGSLLDYLPPGISTNPPHPSHFLKRRLARRLAEAAAFQWIDNPTLHPSQLERYTPEMDHARREFLRETRLLREPPASRTERLRRLGGWFVGGVVVWLIFGRDTWRRLGPLCAGALVMTCICGASGLLNRYLGPWFERPEMIRIHSEFEAQYLEQPAYVDDWTWTLVTLWADQEITIPAELAARQAADEAVRIMADHSSANSDLSLPGDDSPATASEWMVSALGWSIGGALAVALGWAGSNWLRDRLRQTHPGPAARVITAALSGWPLLLAGWLAAGELSTWPPCRTYLPDPPQPPLPAANVARTVPSSQVPPSAPATSSPSTSSPSTSSRSTSEAAVAERRRDPAYLREQQAARDKEQAAFRDYLDGQRAQSLTRVHHSLAERRTSYELAAQAAEERARRHLADASAWRADAATIRRNGSARQSSEGRWATSQRQAQLARQAEEQRSAARRLRSQISGKSTAAERQRLGSQADDLDRQAQKLESDARWSLSTGYQSNRGADQAETQANELLARARRAEAAAESERREAESNRAQARRCAAELAQLDREMASLRTPHSSTPRP
ncbi:MAG: hypothetical protein U0935_13530 [Pirellulales bacterium]